MSAPPHADPGKGVFETMLVIEGQPVELAAHLERLSTSVTALYGVPPPPGAADAILDRAREIRHGKLRLTVVPTGGGRLGARIAAEEVDESKVFPGPERGVALRSCVVVGGLGDHKWADRRLLERAAAASPGEVLLLLDAGDEALEAERGSVFSVSDRGLCTPPIDGRILPSIARRHAIEVARAAGIEVEERRMSLKELRRGEAFLVGSVRGVEPVLSIDGVDLPRPGEISARVGADLRRRWLAVPQGEPVAVAAGGRRAGRHGR